MNSNIKPFLWGPNFWAAIYDFTAVYPEHADSKQIESTRNYFISLKNLLPCESCRNSYQTFITQSDTNISDNDNFSSRNGLIAFVYNLRNKVNNKIELEYGITQSYFKKKLNKMVCTSGNTVDGYTNTLQEAPFIPKKLLDKVLAYMKKNSNYKLDETLKIIKASKNFIDNPEFSVNNKNFKLFYKRNSSCREIIKKIHLNMTYYDYCVADSFYRDNELHLKLFYLGCTIIPTSELEKLL
jgi:hypothetical protein